MSGFITIERSLFDHEFFDDEPMSEREAWMWMIARAQWKDGRHKVGKDMYGVPRGTFMTTLRELQSKFMWRSDTKVRNFLKRLENEGMIERTTVGSRNAPKTHVTVCNYNEYQASERTKNVPETHRERTKNAVKNKGTREQGKRDTVVSPKNGTRLPDTWFLSASLGQWSTQEGATEEMIRREAEKFKDYWKGVAGAKGRKADWDATWRNWIRKAIADNQPKFKAITGGHNGQPANKSEQRVTSFVSGARGAS